MGIIEWFVSSKIKSVLTSKWLYIGIALASLLLLLLITYARLQIKTGDYDTLKVEHNQVVAEHKALQESNKLLLADIASKSAKIKELGQSFNQSKAQAQTTTERVVYILAKPVETTEQQLEVEREINQQFKELQRGVECETGKPSAC